MNITTCGRCGGLYEAGSEEQANEPDRLCPACIRQDRLDRLRVLGSAVRGGSATDAQCAEFDSLEASLFPPGPRDTERS